MPDKGDLARLIGGAGQNAALDGEVEEQVIKRDAVGDAGGEVRRPDDEPFRGLGDRAINQLDRRSDRTVRDVVVLDRSPGESHIP